MSKVPEWPRGRVFALSAQSVAYQFTLARAAHEKLEYAKALLGHVVPSGALPDVIERALDALIEKLECEKLGRRSRTQPAQRRRGGPRRLEPSERHVPDRVKNMVWARDGGQCTFVAANGCRCETRSRLEFDHVQPVGRGGLSTAENLRLLCRAHNQLEAERAHGERFMKGRREASRQNARETRGGERGALPPREIMSRLETSSPCGGAGPEMAREGREVAPPEVAKRALAAIREALDGRASPAGPGAALPELASP